MCLSGVFEKEVEPVKASLACSRNPVSHCASSTRRTAWEWTVTKETRTVWSEDAARSLTDCNSPASSANT